MPVVPDALESSSLDVADFEVENVDVPAAVSYTHLTLPTICSV